MRSASAVRSGAASTFLVSGVPFVTGIVTMASLQVQNGWWLNSGICIIWTLLVLLLQAVLLGESGSGALRVQREATLWVGSMIGLAGVLFWLGPGTIWPIVLIISSAMTGGAVLLGMLVGFALSPCGHAHS